MIKEEEILTKIDKFHLGYYCQFINLGDVNSYLIDCRLNLFKGDNDRWAIVGERLGFNPRSGGILLDIIYFGNCLTNLENYNKQDINYYTISPLNWDEFIKTVDGEALKTDAEFWIIRDKEVALSHNKLDYIQAGIELKEYEPDEISIEEAGRLLTIQNRNLLRATEQELYKSIPADLQKIMALDEWYHRDFNELIPPTIDFASIRATYDYNKKLTAATGQDFMDYDTFKAMMIQQEQVKNDYNQKQWLESRPSSYETWQLLTKVITTGDINLYKPTLPPNTHWTNWPDSGSM
jgi:hypothetical protein